MQLMKINLKKLKYRMYAWGRLLSLPLSKFYSRSLRQKNQDALISRKDPIRGGMLEEGMSSTLTALYVDGRRGICSFEVMISEHLNAHNAKVYGCNSTPLELHFIGAPFGGHVYRLKYVEPDQLGRNVELTIYKVTYTLKSPEAPFAHATDPFECDITMRFRSIVPPIKYEVDYAPMAGKARHFGAGCGWGNLEYYYVPKDCVECTMQPYKCGYPALSFPNGSFPLRFSADICVAINVFKDSSLEFWNRCIGLYLFSEENRPDQMEKLNWIKAEVFNGSDMLFENFKNKFIQDRKNEQLKEQWIMLYRNRNNSDSQFYSDALDSDSDNEIRDLIVSLDDPDLGPEFIIGEEGIESWEA